nr:protein DETOXIFICATION 33-like [Lolium perenne]
MVMIGISKMAGKSWQEAKLMWHIAFPVILTILCNFSIGFVTSAFSGHVGDVELAAVTVSKNVIEGFAYGVLSAWKQRNHS